MLIAMIIIVIVIVTTIITMLIIIIETAPAAWTAPAAFEHRETTQRDKMGTIDKKDNNVGRRVISPPNAP